MAENGCQERDGVIGWVRCELAAGHDGQHRYPPLQRIEHATRSSHVLARAIGESHIEHVTRVSHVLARAGRGE